MIFIHQYAGHLNQSHNTYLLQGQALPYSIYTQVSKICCHFTFDEMTFLGMIATDGIYTTVQNTAMHELWAWNILSSIGTSLILALEACRNFHRHKNRLSNLMWINFFLARSYERMGKMTESVSIMPSPRLQANQTVISQSPTAKIAKETPQVKRTDTIKTMMSCKAIPATNIIAPTTSPIFNFSISKITSRTSLYLGKNTCQQPCWR